MAFKGIGKAIASAVSAATKGASAATKGAQEATKLPLRVFGKKLTVAPNVTKEAALMKKPKSIAEALMMAKTGMKKGGAVKKGMHKMPDGSMMKNSDMAGRALKRKTADAKGRAMKKGK